MTNDSHNNVLPNSLTRWILVFIWDHLYWDCCKSQDRGVLGFQPSLFKSTTIYRFLLNSFTWLWILLTFTKQITLFYNDVKGASIEKSSLKKKDQRVFNSYSECAGVFFQELPLNFTLVRPTWLNQCELLNPSFYSQHEVTWPCLLMLVFQQPHSEPGRYSEPVYIERVIKYLSKKTPQLL